jgi:hypothetical protein
MKYTLEQQISLYNSHVKKKSYKLCKVGFCLKYLGVHVLDSSTIFRLVKMCIQLGLS